MNKWLEEEEKMLRKTYKLNKNIARNNHRGLLACVILTCFLVPYLPFLHSKNETSSHFYTTEFFPKVWTCKCCGYENYEGINTCAVCGTSK